MNRRRCRRRHRHHCPCTYAIAADAIAADTDTIDPCVCLWSTAANINIKVSQDDPGSGEDMSGIYKYDTMDDMKMVWVKDDGMRLERHSALLFIYSGNFVWATSQAQDCVHSTLPGVDGVTLTFRCHKKPAL